MTSQPTLSIITSTYNAAGTLRDTLRSVALQEGVETEHIVIDANSSDNTGAVIGAHGQHVSTYVKEPDAGIYDGMNKGARIAKGEIIGFLNADDWLAGPTVLSEVTAAFASGADLVYGDIALVTQNAPYLVKRHWKDSPHSPNDFYARGWQPAHPSTYVSRKLFERIGGFDLRWKIAADYAFFARVMKEPSLRIKYLPYRMVNMRLGGASTAGIGAIWRANRECASALSEAGIALPWMTIAMKLARKGRQIQSRSNSAADGALWRPWDSE
jgi:glycosyltransferase involved in cell wall biosynthesis